MYTENIFYIYLKTFSIIKLFQLSTEKLLFVYIHKLTFFFVIYIINLLHKHNFSQFIFPSFYTQKKFFKIISQNYPQKLTTKYNNNIIRFQSLDIVLFPFRIDLDNSTTLNQVQVYFQGNIQNSLFFKKYFSQKTYILFFYILFFPKQLKIILLFYIYFSIRELFFCLKK